jgi:hypothetical protein
MKKPFIILCMLACIACKDDGLKDTLKINVSKEPLDKPRQDQFSGVAGRLPGPLGAIKITGGGGGPLGQITMGNPPINKIVEENTGLYTLTQGSQKHELKRMEMLLSWPKEKVEIKTTMTVLNQTAPEQIFGIAEIEGNISIYENGAWQEPTTLPSLRQSNPKTAAQIDCLKNLDKNCFSLINK